MTRLKKFNKIVIMILIFVVFASLGTPVFAQGLKDAFGTNDGSANDPLDTVAGQAGYDISSADTQIETTLGRIIQAALSLLGVVFLGLMIYGGYVWMTAHGNEQRVEKAKNIIQAAIIGLIIVVSAYAIAYFVISKLGTGTLTPSQ